MAGIKLADTLERPAVDENRGLARVGAVEITRKHRPGNNLLQVERQFKEMRRDLNLDAGLAGLRDLVDDLALDEIRDGSAAQRLCAFRLVDSLRDATGFWRSVRRRQGEGCKSCHDRDVHDRLSSTSA